MYVLVLGHKFQAGIYFVRDVNGLNYQLVDSLISDYEFSIGFQINQFI